MTEMSAAEAAVVARFEAGEPAPESWGGGLREAIARALHYDWHSEEEWDATPDSVLGYYRRLADVTLALPEVAALRAKADAADRVRELAEECEVIGNDRKAGIVKRSLNRAVAGRVLRALNGTDRTDRGPC